jgi:hypothetical protein
MVTIGTDSYGNEVGLTAFALLRGIAIALPTGSTQTLDEYKTTLLISAMDNNETKSYLGVKTVSTQALQFPRYGIIIDSYDIDSTTVPTDIVKAQYIAALKIYEGYDLQSTLGQSIKREKVSSLETEYQDYTSGAETHRALDDILSPFIQSGSKVVRV